MRHPKVVCTGNLLLHDVPISQASSNSRAHPNFAFKGLDENKPTGSIKIRIETIDYFLRRYREEIVRKRKAEQYVEVQLAARQVQLRHEKSKSFREFQMASKQLSKKTMTDMNRQLARGVRTACPSGTEDVCKVFVETGSHKDQVSRILIPAQPVDKRVLHHSGEQP